MTKHCDDPSHQLMCREYASLPALIVFWGGLSWQKNQFFCSVESILLAGIGVALKDTFIGGKDPTESAFLMLTIACVFNFWICYVWFRTNRTNRDYLTPLLLRACTIEGALGDRTATFSAQQGFLQDSKRNRHSAEWWERHLPTGFAVAWAAALLIGASYGQYWGWAFSTLVLSLLILLLLELFHPSRAGNDGGKAAASGRHG